MMIQLWTPKILFLFLMLSPHLNRNCHCNSTTSTTSATSTETTTTLTTTTATKSPKKKSIFCKSKFMEKSLKEFQATNQRKPYPGYKFTEDDLPLTGSGVGNETLVMLFGSSLMVKIPIESIKSDHIDPSGLSRISLDKHFRQLKTTNYSTVYHYTHFSVPSFELTRLGIYSRKQSFQSFVVLNSFNQSIQQFRNEQPDFDYVFNASGSGYLVRQQSTNSGQILFAPFQYQFPIELVKFPNQSISFYYWIQISPGLVNILNRDNQSFVNQTVTFIRVNSSELLDPNNHNNIVGPNQNQLQFNGNISGFIQNSVVYLFDLSHVYYFDYIEQFNEDRTQFRLTKVEWRVFFLCWNSFDTLIPLELWLALLVIFLILLAAFLYRHRTNIKSKLNQSSTRKINQTNKTTNENWNRNNLFQNIFRTFKKNNKSNNKKINSNSNKSKTSNSSINAKLSTESMESSSRDDQANRSKI